MIGLAPLVPVIFKQHGGTNQHLVTSVELLQSNNLALNSASNGTCLQLEETIVEWVRTNAFETSIHGTKFLHMLSLEVEPARCGFQSGDRDGPLAAYVCTNYDLVERCRSLFGLDNCHNLCVGWQTPGKEDRMTYMEHMFGVRPSVTVTVENSEAGTYMDGGEVVSAYFSVRVLYNEQLSVRRT